MVETEQEAGRIRVYQSPDGSFSFVNEATGEVLAGQRISETGGGIVHDSTQSGISLGSRLVAELIIHTVPIGGQDWYILETGVDGFMLFDLLAPRLSDGRIDNTTRPALRRIMAAMIFGCLVKGKQDDTPYFDTIEAAEVEVKNPKKRTQILDLYNACCRHNTFSGESEAASSESDDAPPVNSEDSTGTLVTLPTGATS